MLLAFWGDAAAQSPALSPEARRAIAAISANSLRGNLSFLASDQLEGRDTPSRGLDLAALYIAAQFRRAGLEPAGDDGYFQTAKLLRVEDQGGFELRFKNGQRTLAAPRGEATAISEKPLNLTDVRVVRVRKAEDVTTAAGKVVAVEVPGAVGLSLTKAAAALHPAAFLELANEDDPAPRFVETGEERARYGEVPRLILRDPEAIRMVKESGGVVTVSARLAAASATVVTVRNVAGVLRGSDAAMRDRYVVLSAHYDHLGRNADGQVYPGANDDGSGTVSVMEIAQALAGMAVHPKRSIVFLLFFGEEEGSLGSRYYTSHPLFPLAKTVADLNLEQVGRTDASNGTHVADATLTGFRYSSIAKTLQEAGVLTGVKVYETPDGDDYFNRSDNQTFAEHGIPAHTIVVALEYPDYHGVGDNWHKIDYGNMAKVDRMVAVAVIRLADDAVAASWNRENGKARQYLRQGLRP